MSKVLPLAFAFLAMCGVAAAGADDATTVEVFLPFEHVPEGLKAGARVDLVAVTGKSVTRTGKVVYTTRPVIANLEVATVKKVEKPRSPDQAIKVELKVTKRQAEVIEKIKALLVTVTEASSDGTTTTVKRPVPLRLEPVKAKE